MSRNHTHKWSATILMAAILFVVSSCDGVTPGRPGQELPEVILPQTEFNVPFMGGEVEVSFVPLTSWKVSCNAQFITFDKTGGEKSEEITTLKIKVLPNPDTKKRQAEVELEFENNDITLIVSQEGAPGDIDPPVGGDSDLSSGTEDVIPGLLI